MAGDGGGGDDGTRGNDGAAGVDGAAAAFDALADQRRVAILRALYDAEQEASAPEDLRLTFSALYDRVEVDGTSTFSYHLDKLTDTYLTKGDGGYALTATGRRVVRAVLAGTYTDLPTFEGVSVAAICPNCEHSPVEAVCEQGVLAVVCPDCAMPFVRDHVQPAHLADRTPREVVESYDRKLRRDMALEVDGICSECSGAVNLTLRPSSEQITLAWLAVVDCRQCGKHNQFPPYLALLDHPLVVSFYWDHGVDLTAVRIWEVMAFVVDGEWTPEVVSTDPFRCRVRIEREGDELSVTLDEHLRVSDATRRASRDPLPDE